MTTAKEAIENLDSMQSQIIHGKRTFGDIADVIRDLQKRVLLAETAVTACHSAMLGKVNPKHPAWGCVYAVQDAKTPIGESKTPMDVAIAECEGMAVMIDVWAGRATEQDHKNGQYGNWCHDSEVLRFAAHLLKRYQPTKPGPQTTACGDCDPCLGGRPDQCAVMAKGKL